MVIYNIWTALYKLIGITKKFFLDILKVLNLIAIKIKHFKRCTKVCFLFLLQRQNAISIFVFHCTARLNLFRQIIFGLQWWKYATKSQRYIICISINSFKNGPIQIIKFVLPWHIFLWRIPSNSSEYMHQQNHTTGKCRYNWQSCSFSLNKRILQILFWNMKIDH